MRLPVRLSLEEVLAHSYRDFHVRGFDYLCLRRAEADTLKVYVYENEAAAHPEVVAPHDHRYGFFSTVAAGELRNWRYVRRPEADHDTARPYERFAYRTLLNGGDGFAWEAEEWLTVRSAEVYGPGAMPHYHSADELHTIAVRAGTVLFQRQGRDVVPLSEPTHCWRPAGRRDPPSLSGLYRQMDPDRARELIALAYGLAGSDPPELAD